MGGTLGGFGSGVTSVNSLPTTFSGSVVMSPAPTGSPWTYTNNSVGLQQIYLTGTLSAVQFTRSGNNTALSALTAQFLLGPGDGITVNYLTAPTVTVVQLI